MLYALKQKLVVLNHAVGPLLESTGKLLGGRVPHRCAGMQEYFRDVYDHLVRLHEQIEAARDLLGNAREAWLSMVANRTNEVTKRLTLIATLFLPLSFITGFFGQNFAVLSRPLFFWSMIALMVAVPLALLGWFWRKRWL
jgi:magnesium transporter